MVMIWRQVSFLQLQNLPCRVDCENKETLWIGRHWAPGGMITRRTRWHLPSQAGPWGMTRLGASELKAVISSS